MADVSKLKARRGLPPPPPMEEASSNLSAPEHAPQAPTRVDGRSARRTGRTVQFATRVSPDFDERLRQIAARDHLLLVEILERALDAYEASR